MKMKYYAQYLELNWDDSPMYIFDGSFGDVSSSRCCTCCVSKTLLLLMQSATSVYIWTRYGCKPFDAMSGHSNEHGKLTESCNRGRNLSPSKTACDPVTTLLNFPCWESSSIWLFVLDHATDLLQAVIVMCEGT